MSRVRKTGYHRRETLANKAMNVRTGNDFDDERVKPPPGYLTEDAEAITKRLLKQYPKGPLLRNTRGSRGTGTP